MLPHWSLAFSRQSIASQAGNSLVILLLIVGLITGGVLLESKFGKGLPAEPSPTPVSVQYKGELTLSPYKDLKSLKAGDRFVVSVGISTKEAVNLISTKIHYPKELLKVTLIDDLKDQSPVSLWVSKDDFPDEGLVQLVGGIPNPGLQTDGQTKLIARINFQAATDLTGKSFQITPMETQLYSNASNQPLEHINVISITSDQPAASPAQNSPTPTVSASPQTLSKGSLSLSPKVLQTGSGCTFDVVLSYDSGGSEFLGIDALLTVDPRVLKPISVVKTNNPADSLQAPQLAFKNDTLTLAYLSPTTRPYQKKADLAKITFKVTDQPSQGMTAIKIKYNSSNKNDLTDSNILLFERNTLDDLAMREQEDTTERQPVVDSYSLKDDLLSEVNSTIVALKPGSCNTSPPPQSYQLLSPQK